MTPLVVGATGMLIERTMLKQLYKLDHLYGLLLTFGLALIIQGLFRHEFGSSGMPYPVPEVFLKGCLQHRLHVLAQVPRLGHCGFAGGVFDHLVRDRANQAGAYLRAATENPSLVQAFGINVPRMITLTYGFGVGLAAFAGCHGCNPSTKSTPTMGADIIIVVFAVVVIGGMGSIMGAIPHRFWSGSDRRPDQGVLPPKLPAR